MIRIAILLMVSGLQFSTAHAEGGRVDFVCGENESSTDCLITALNQFRALGCEVDSNLQSAKSCAVEGRTISFKNCDWAAHFSETNQDRLNKACLEKNKNFVWVKNGARHSKFPGVCVERAQVKATERPKAVK